MKQLLLIRHGRSSHVHSGWLDRAAFDRWRVAYEAAGIVGDEVPPAELRELARSAGILVSSDAPRAIASAKAIGPDARLVTSPLLRELEMSPPNLGRLRLPLALWGIAWLIGGRVLPEEIARARAAALWLEQLSNEHPALLVVTHGSFRRVLADELPRIGWTPARDRRRIHHWSVYRFTRD